MAPQGLSLRAGPPTPGEPERPSLASLRDLAPHGPPRQRGASRARLRLRLALYFVLLAFIPLTVVGYVLSRNVVQSEHAKADARLGVIVRAAQAELAAELERAAERARRLASSPELQRALETAARPTLRRLAAENPETAIYLGRKLVAGSLPRPAAVRSVEVEQGGRTLGEVAVSVPLDRATVDRLSRIIPTRGDLLVLVRAGRVAAARGDLQGLPIRFRGGRVAVAGGVDYRASSVPAFTNDRSTELVALTAASSIDAAVSRFRRLLGLAVLASLGAVGVLAYALGRPILSALSELHQVARLADRDDLTDLPNRRGYRGVLEREIQRAERFGGSVALVLADLDDFKQVNDRFGHKAGDEVLRLFADVLRDCVRDIDVPARLGGEEFAVVLPGTGVEGGRQLAERLRLRLAGHRLELSHGRSVTVTASFGVAAFPEHATEADLATAADTALYRAKSYGKNQVVIAMRR